MKEKISAKKINETIGTTNKVLKVLYFLLVLAAIYVVLLVLKETQILKLIGTILAILAPLFIGIIIAWLFDPLVTKLEKHKINRTLGALVSYAILLFIIFVILATLFPLLFQQLIELGKTMPDIYESIKTWCVNFFSHIGNIGGINAEEIKNQVLNKTQDLVTTVGSGLPSAILSGASSLLSGVTVFGVGLIIGFFLLIGFNSSEKIIYIIPKKIRKDSKELFTNINNALRRYARGALIDCSVVFILTSIGLWAVGLKAPALFGLFCGLTNIIPYIGPYIGGAPAVVVGLTQSPTIGILTLIVIIVVQFLEGNFLQPVIMAKTTKLHPVTIMLGLLVFGHFFGMIGMLLSTPILSVIKTIFIYFNRKYDIIDIEREKLQSLEENIEKEK